MQVNALIKQKLKSRECVCKNVFLLGKNFMNTIWSMAMISTSIRWLNCCVFSLTTHLMLETTGCKRQASETMKSNNCWIMQKRDLISKMWSIRAFPALLIIRGINTLWETKCGLNSLKQTELLSHVFEMCFLYQDLIWMETAIHFLRLDLWRDQTRNASTIWIWLMDALTTLIPQNGLHRFRFLEELQSVAHLFQLQ